MSLVESIAERVKEKPIPSLVAFELLKVIENEDHSLKEVVRLVENDASLTSEVLKVANSAAFYRGTPVTTVNRALLLMGEMMVVGVAICASTSIIYHSPLEGYESAAGEMWDHSLRSAIAARELTRYSKKSISPALAFTAGLLHDIGKAVISEFLVGHTRTMTELCANGGAADYLEAERNMVGTDHTQVGYLLAQHWQLPEVLCLVIRDHHRPSQTKEEHKTLVHTVHLADLVSMLGGAGTGADSLAYKVDEESIDHFKITKDDLNWILLKVQEDFLVLKESLLVNA
ncbi:MAG: HDOD domain-containing protein [Calditrichaeota bacterium]|nr:MAG: HDOD domain-containing protein [Calditrichota bacterium]